MSNQYFKDTDTTESILGRIQAITEPQGLLKNIESATRHLPPKERFEAAVKVAMHGAKTMNAYLSEGVAELERRLEVKE